MNILDNIEQSKERHNLRREHSDMRSQLRKKIFAFNVDHTGDRDFKPYTLYHDRFHKNCQVFVKCKQTCQIER